MNTHEFSNWFKNGQLRYLCSQVHSVSPCSHPSLFPEVTTILNFIFIIPLFFFMILSHISLQSICCLVFCIFELYASRIILSLVFCDFFWLTLYIFAHLERQPSIAPINTAFWYLFSRVLQQIHLEVELLDYRLGASLKLFMSSCFPNRWYIILLPFRRAHEYHLFLICNQNKVLKYLFICLPRVLSFSMWDP